MNIPDGRTILFWILQFAVQCVNTLLQLCLKFKSCAEYKNQVKVYKVLWRHKTPERLDFSRMKDFLCVFERLTHPEVVLNDEYSLYCITPDEAVFVHCGCHDVFNSSHHAFVYNAQFALAQQVVVLPMSTFHKIASNIHLPDIPLVHLPNHGRCGSTLLTRMFEAIPGALSVSETNAFTDLASLSQRGEVVRDVLRDMCRGVIMFTVKHCNSRNATVMFIKLQNIATYVTDVMVEAVPQLKHVYMYRQPLAFVRSYEKLNFVNKWDSLSAPMCAFWSGLGENEILKKFPNRKYTDDGFIYRLSPFSRLALIWITGVAAYCELVHRCDGITSLKYEDLLADPREVMKAVLKHLGIDGSLLPDVDAVMGRDSQAGSEYTSRGVDKKELERSLTPITLKLKAEVDVLCEDFDVSSFWDDVRLPNDILASS